MLRTLLLAALVLPLTAMGCATAQSASGDASDSADIDVVMADDPFRLAVGESVRVGEHTVRFVEVTEDSRCPQGVECVWPGVARVAVEVDGATVELTVPHTTPRDGETAEVRVGAQMLEVTALTPYPGSAAAEAGDPVEAAFVVRS